ncbi:helix-turn-helix domain-containing protein [Streptomyces prunicolor]|uniref:Helix-turn-helix domain-containing protein n=1 Tax=Streptomyces prunicolor TaxID=67348 RepID=A0ABU4F8C4_9ACTN|nr:helix-turn-helix domain-containing protein [Streptomyces prunicolor]MDV7216842.1 helix-turn-helix domain-containing protein [Streptomyces prunicolor]
MDRTGVEADGSVRAPSRDSGPSGSGAAPGAFDAFRDGWETEIGDGFPLPTFSPATMRDFRVRSRATKVGDVAVTDLHGASAIRTEGPLNGVEDQVRMYVVRSGSWSLGAPLARDEQTVPAGQFLIRHIGRPVHFETVPDTRAKVLVLPAATLRPLLGERQSVSGPADSAEVRLLVAHSNMIYETAADLGPAGVQAAHSTLIELAKAVARRRVDDTEPQLASALAQAAKDLADNHLTDPELSGAMLARELNVSVRSLQRAFAAAGESVAAYIRQRRLEEARLALTAPSGRLSVSELAAHWQFADSSHFIRAFKKHYGRTPTEYARSTTAARN